MPTRSTWPRFSRCVRSESIGLGGASGPSISDGDSPDFDGGSLTVAISAGFVSGEDTLGIDTTNVTLSAGLTVVAGSLNMIDATHYTATVTATDDVIEDIRRQLGRPAMEVVQTSLYRPNLRLQVAQCVNEEEKLGHLLKLV